MEKWVVQSGMVQVSPSCGTQDVVEASNKVWETPRDPQEMWRVPFGTWIRVNSNVFVFMSSNEIGSRGYVQAEEKVKKEGCI